MLSPERLKIVANPEQGGRASGSSPEQEQSHTSPREAIRTNLRYNKVIALPTLCELMDSP